MLYYNAEVVRVYLLIERGGVVAADRAIALVRCDGSTRIIEDGGERRSSFAPRAIARRTDRFWASCRTHHTKGR